MAKLKPVEFLTPERRAEIEKEIVSLEKQMSGGDDNDRSGVGFMSHAVNRVSTPEDIKREIMKKRVVLDKGTPKPFESVAMKNSAYAWAKKAEKWIKERAPRDVFVKYPTKGRQEHDFDRSVQNMADWMKKGEKVYRQYRYIMRRLNPENPNAGKIRGV